MNGRMLSENAKIVTALKPIDTTGATWATDVFNLENYGHITFIVEQGAWAGGSSTMTVEYCDNVTPTTDTAMAFNYRQDVMDGTSDALGALTAGTTSGIALSVANTMTVIEIDAAEVLSASSGANSYVKLAGTSPGANTDLISVIAILTQPRWKANVPPTAIV